MKFLSIFIAALLCYTSTFSQSKIYLHTDRAVYSPKETVYFSGVVCNEDLSYDTDHKILYIEYYNADSVFVDTYLASIVKGKVKGQISLGEYEPLGTARLKAFVTRDSLGKLEPYALPILIKPFNGLDEVESKVEDVAEPLLLEAENLKNKTINTTIQKPKLMFYPEGGELIANTNQKIGVVASDAWYRPLSLRAELITSDGSVSIAFETDKDGLGMVQTRLDADKLYSVRVTLADQEFNYDLPDIKKQGYALGVEDMVSQLKVEVTLPADEKATVLVYGRGKVLISRELDQGGTVNVNKDLLPEGISRVRLLDIDQQPVCERLVFKNYDSPKVDLQIDKPKYKAGEIFIFNLTGPVGTYSASFLDKNYPDYCSILHPSIDKSLMFFNELSSLNPNLSAYPGDASLGDAKQIEKMLLTYGWRSFNEEGSTFDTEDKLFIRGRILNVLTKRPMKGERVLLNIKKGFITKPIEVYSDDDGKFEILLGKYSGSLEFKLFVLNKKNRQQKAIFEVETNRHKWRMDNTQDLNQVVKSEAKQSGLPDVVSFKMDLQANKQTLYAQIRGSKGYKEVLADPIKTKRVENDDFFLNDTVVMLNEVLSETKVPLGAREEVIAKIGKPILSMNHNQLIALNKDVKMNTFLDYLLIQWPQLRWYDPDVDPDYKKPYRLTINGDETVPVFILLNGERYYYGENAPSDNIDSEDFMESSNNSAVRSFQIEADRQVLDRLDLSSIEYIDLIKPGSDGSDFYGDFEDSYLSGEYSFGAFAISPYIINIISSNQRSTSDLELAGTIAPKRFYRFHQKLTPEDDIKRLTTKTVQWFPENKLNKKYGFELNKVNGNMIAIFQGMTTDAKPFSLYKEIDVSQNTDFLAAEIEKKKSENSEAEMVKYDMEEMEGDGLVYDDFLKGTIIKKSTNKALANVLVSTAKGVKTLSNGNGTFVLPLGYVKENTNLTFTAPGFLNQYSTIKKGKRINPVSFLVEDTTVISEAKITEGMVRKAYLKTLKLRKNELAEVFLREKVWRNLELHALNEYQFVYSLKRITGDDRYVTTVKKARTFETSEYSGNFAYKPLTSNLRTIYDMDLIMNPKAFLNPIMMNKFDYRLLSEATYNARACYLIQFDQKTTVRESLQSGFIWIDKEDGYICYVEFGLSNKGKAYFDPLQYFNRMLASDMKPGAMKYTNGYHFDGDNVYLDYATEYIVIETPQKDYKFEKEWVATKSLNNRLALEAKTLSDLDKKSLLIKKPKYNSSFWLNTPVILPEKEVMNQIEFLHVVNLYTVKTKK